MTAPSQIADDQPRRPRALTGALVGVLAAAVAMGAAQFASGLGVPQSSPVLAVGQVAIDLTPPPVKDFAISAFGTHDKTVLLGGILVVIALYAAVVGMLAVRRLAFGLWGLAVFGCLGLAGRPAPPTRPGGRRSAAGLGGSPPGGARGGGVRADLAGPRGGGAQLCAGPPWPARRVSLTRCPRLRDPRHPAWP